MTAAETSAPSNFDITVEDGHDMQLTRSDTATEPSLVISARDLRPTAMQHWSTLG